VSSRRSVVVIPLKSFDVAKSRLRTALSDTQLAELARELAAGVIAASAPRACVVLGDSSEVEQFATERGASFLYVSSRGLNSAVDDGLLQLREKYDLAIVAHGDLARPAGLGSFEFDDEMTVVTDRHGLGTNVLAVPLEVPFRAQYGEGSAARHIAQGRELGLSVRVIRDSPWGLDIDDPDDFEMSRQG
jgi:2-phospho-L-lactate guanylyltransferase